MNGLLDPFRRLSPDQRRHVIVLTALFTAVGVAVGVLVVFQPWGTTGTLVLLGGWLVLSMASHVVTIVHGIWRARRRRR